MNKKEEKVIESITLDAKIVKTVVNKDEYEKLEKKTFDIKRDK